MSFIKIIIIFLNMREKTVDNFTLDYNNLWKMLIDKSLKKTDLMKLAGISSSTLAKMGKGEPVSIGVIGRICVALSCSIEDVVRVVY